MHLLAQSEVGFCENTMGRVKIHLLSCCMIILKQEVCLPVLTFDLYESNAFLTVLVWVARFSLYTQKSDSTDKKY